MRTPALLAAMLLVCAAARSAQEAKDEPALVWQTDLATAFATAAEERRPLMVQLFPAGMGSPQESLQPLLDHEDFGKFADRLLYAIGMPDQHEEERVEVAGLERHICRALGGLSCSEHKGLWTDVQALLPESKELPLPQTLLFDPDHELIFWRACPLTANTLVDLLQRTLRASGIDPVEGTALEDTPQSDEAWFAVQMAQVRRETTIYDKRALLAGVASRPSATLQKLVLEQLRAGSDIQLRAGLADLVAAPGEVTVLEPLREALKNKDERLSLAAVDGLRRVGLPSAVPDLLPLLKVHRAGQAHGRVVMALASCGDGDEEIRERILKEARQYDAGLRCFGIMALGHLTPDQDTRKLLEKSLKDRLTRIRAAAVWAAGTCRDPELEKAVGTMRRKERVEDVMEVAVRALQRIQDPAFESEPGDRASWDSAIEDHVSLIPPWS